MLKLGACDRMTFLFQMVKKTSMNDWGKSAFA